LTLARALYDQFVAGTVPVSSPETAEGGETHRKHFRAVNIAPRQRAEARLRRHGHRCLGGDRGGEIETFGSCRSIPDLAWAAIASRSIRFTVTWKAREHDVSHTLQVELAGEINTAMPAMWWNGWPPSIGDRAQEHRAHAFCCWAFLLQEECRNRYAREPKLQKFDGAHGTARAEGLGSTIPSCLLFPIMRD